VLLNITFLRLISMQIIKSIQSRIYETRRQRVMLDSDLAFLYDVPTKSLNLSVKRNILRFPDDFMFQLTKAEYEVLRFQIETIEKSDNPLRLQNETSNRGGRRYMPYAFTEQGVAMLSGVINSAKAIEMNINIMRAFADVRRIIMQQLNINEKMREITERLSEHDIQLTQIYDAMENLLDEKAAQKKWADRERIGFKK
jgi:hypothetical protein